MRRQNEYTPSQYRLFDQFRQLLSEYSTVMEVITDQRDSYYLAYPKIGIYREKAGTMFAAVQIMEVTVAIYLPILMNKQTAMNEEQIKDVAGYLDSRGVIQILLFNESVAKTTRNLLRLTADLKHTKAFKEVFTGNSIVISQTASLQHSPR